MAPGQLCLYVQANLTYSPLDYGSSSVYCNSDCYLDVAIAYRSKPVRAPKSNGELSPHRPNSCFFAKLTTVTSDVSQQFTFALIDQFRIESVA